MSVLRDALGVEHAPAAPGARIVSMVPSITELLIDLGLAAQVVGRTGFCVHPHAAVADIPKVGGTKDLKFDVLRALAPTHVIVNIDENRREDVDALRAFVPHIVVTHPLAPEDNLALYRLMGALFDRREAAEALGAQLTAELAACRATAWPQETVLYLVWKDPWMTIATDTYIARTLARVGWTVPHAAGGFAGAARYPTITLEAELPRVARVLLSTEPYLFTEADVLALRDAHPATPVDLIDAEMTSWYGSRAITGLRYLRGYRASRLAA